MRINRALARAILAAIALFTAGASAEERFDACDILTQADAEQALGTTAAAEPVNPKARRPKVVTSCTYNGFKDGKPVAATAQFRFARSDAEMDQAFEEARLKFQTKPFLLPGAEAFWSGKLGQMSVRKGRTWVTLTVGPAKAQDRDDAEAKKLAVVLIPKI
jgi:hypothetical protein